ncbi:hypothetical protein, partial [Thioclava sp. F28-4]|uniref:hypothetical protein n=1 Tax=Thioclava sp. F28-4 TaxID=1915315 RepID=UPI001AF02912
MARPAQKVGGRLLLEGRSNLYPQPLVEVLEPTLQRRFGNEEGSLPHVYVSHVNAVLIFPKSAEVKFPTTAVAAISR